MTRRLLPLLALLTLVHPGRAQTRPPSDPLRGFEAYVEQARKDWGVPGLAVAVVKGDSVVFLRGFGVRHLGDPAPVTIHTLFSNASTTKAFTALAVGQQVDAGHMKWDDPLTRWFPGFALKDPYASREFTIRDALTHVVGFGDPEFLWDTGNLSFEEMIRRLRLISPTTSFRERFQYNNVTYAAAGYAAARAAGVSFAELLRRGVLDPLGMNETVLSTGEALTHPDFAAPHFRIKDTVIAIPLDFRVDSVAPAGAMLSSISDMSHWLRALLDSGRVAPGGARLLTPASFSELFSPQVEVRDTAYPTAALAQPHFSSYGFGWFLQDYRGRFVAFHTGSLDGYSAIVGLIPEERVGVVVFANLDHAEVRHALMYRVFDAYLGGPPRDWSKELRALYGARVAARKKAEELADSHRQSGTRPTVSLDRYVGVYSDSLYGSAEVKLEEGHLVLSYPGSGDGDLQHWHFDTFTIAWRKPWLGHDRVVFKLDGDGHVTGLDFYDMHLGKADAAASR